MSFEGYYQTVCEGGCYFEEDVYTAHLFEVNKGHCSCGKKIIFSNLVDDTNCEAAGHIAIPVVDGKVRKDFFDMYLKDERCIEKLTERRDALIAPGYLQDEPLEKMVSLFPYFDKGCQLRIEYLLMPDESGALVPYCTVGFGKKTFDDAGRENFEVAYIDRYGMMTGKDTVGAYECFVMGYETNVRDLVFELYTQMWKRNFLNFI